MIDITEEVETQVRKREPGRWTPDLLLFQGQVIGHLECGGAVIDRPAFCCLFRPNRAGHIEKRIFRLEPHELPD